MAQRNVPSVTVTMKSYPERDSGNDGEEGVITRLTNKLGATSEIKQRQGLTFKTDKSKRRNVCFGKKVLTDKKSARFLFRSIFNPSHHSLRFCFYFLPV
jgi:hypothetical protein